MSNQLIFLAGEADPMVPFTYGKMSSDLIKAFPSANYQFKTYPGLGHSSSPQVGKIHR